jgi:hypothetical protein
MFPSKINGCSVKGVAVAHKYTYFFETTSVVNIKKTTFAKIANNANNK